MLFTDAGSGKAAALAQEVGGDVAATNAELAAEAELVILAMKPKQLAEVAGEAREAKAVMSLLGAVPLERLVESFPGAAVMRLMPNLGVEVGMGVMCFAAAPGTDQELVRGARDLLGPLGRVVEIGDELFDPATAVMGCTPAYLAQVGEAIAAEGAREGLDYELSFSLTVDTAAATAELLRTRSAGELIEAVASPGGSTEAGLQALQREGAAEAFEAAVRASLARMRGEDA
jgi:pyrroline-5-carboxylate reductase